MTRDVAAQAVHERLEHAVSSMPAFDVDAGWAALASQLDGPVAPVIPLRRRHPRRVVTLAVAAAVLIGGSALAAIRHGGAGSTFSPIATLPAAGIVSGPHTHPAFSGAPPSPDSPADAGGQGPSGGSHSSQAPPPVDQPTGGGDGSSTGSSQASPTHVDSPDDTDHGTGNDGHHDDNGQGNDTGGSSGSQGDQGDQGQNTQGDRGSDGGQGGGGGQGSGNGN
jgi:hypothetical protein